MTAMFRGMRATIVAMSITLLAAHSAKAGIVTLNFTGTVSTIDDPNGFITGVKVGDSYSGSLVYDDSHPIDVPVADPATYTFLPPLASPLGISLTLGSHTFTIDSNLLMQITVGNDLTTGSFPDLFGAVSSVNPGTNKVLLAGLVLGDPTGTAFSSTALPTSLDLSKFATRGVNLHDSAQGAGTNIFTGTINLAAVPEPTSVTLLGLGLLGTGAWSLRRRWCR